MPAYRPRLFVYEKICKYREEKKFVRDLLREQVRPPREVDWRIPFELLQETHEAQDVERKEETRLPPLRFISEAPRRIRQKRADEIERPKIWTAVTFRNYVKSLTLSSVDRFTQRRVYGGATTHVEAVAQILQTLFEDVERKALLTTEACNAALGFFYKNGMIPKARAVFDQVENLCIKVQPEIVNVILRSTAMDKDIDHYTFILRAMLRRGFKPTGETWVTLLMAVESSEAREVIFREMEEIGILKDGFVLKRAVDLVIPDIVSSWETNGLDAASFVAFMDSQYGNRWIDSRGANKLLFEYGCRNDIREVMDLFDILVERGMVPNVGTLNTLITVCSLQVQHDAVIDILRRFRDKYHLHLGDIGHVNLFKLAWKRRMYNCCRVLWRSACIEAAVSFQVQDLIYRSLVEGRLNPQRDETRSRGQIWKASVGQVILGVSPNKLFDQRFAIFTKRPESTALGAGNPEEPDGQMQSIIAALVRGDIAKAGRLHLVRDVTDLLSDALERDREWHRSQVLRTQDAAWKRENALPVEVKHGPRVASTWRRRRRREGG